MSNSRGSIWQAAKRGEGYQLARNSNVVWFLVVIAWFLRLIFVVCLFRFFSGRPMLGDKYRKSDATWSTPGRNPFNPTSPTTRPLSRWSRQTERTRAGIRTSCLIITIAIGWALIDDSFYGGSLIHLGFSIAAVLCLWWALYKLTHKSSEGVKNWRQNREVVRPIQAALSKIIGEAPEDINVVLPMPKRKKAS